MNKHTQTPGAFVRGANLDTSMMYMGSIMSFLVRAHDTDGRFAMVEYRARPGNEPPPHVHLWEHEIYFVLEGKIEFHCEPRSRRSVPDRRSSFRRRRPMRSISDPNTSER
jgi:quercetin dioxygenase-like cupin family protein